jgi:hypothetical protein
MFLKIFGQKRAISVLYDRKIFLPPVVNISGKNFLGALFNIQKCPWKLVPPPPNLLMLPTPLFIAVCHGLNDKGLHDLEKRMIISKLLGGGAATPPVATAL